MSETIRHNISRKQFLQGSAGIAAGMMAMGLVGCGGSSSDSSSGDSSSSDSSAADYTLIKDGTIISVGDYYYPPLLSMDDSGNVEGFEVDMLAALCEKMGLKAEWLPTTKFDTLIPLIKQGGKADVSISSFTITDERKQEIDFTDPYLDSNQSLVTRADSPNQTAESLNVDGMRVCAQAGTTGEAWIQENIPNAECVPVDDTTGIMNGIQSGLYEGGVLDLPVASYLCKVSYTDLTVAESIATGEQYGIVVSKDNPGLTEALNKALEEIKSDGTYDQIQEKWFGETISE